MFCPNCATKQIDGAHFCRSCGANISLVPQANPPGDDDYRRGRRGPSSDYAIRSIMSGIAFAVMAVMVLRFAPGSSHWWFWLLVPAFMHVLGRWNWWAPSPLRWVHTRIGFSEGPVAA